MLCTRGNAGFFLVLILGLSLVTVCQCAWKDSGLKLHRRNHCVAQDGSNRLLIVGGVDASGHVVSELLQVEETGAGYRSSMSLSVLANNSAFARRHLFCFVSETHNQLVVYGGDHSGNVTRWDLSAVSGTSSQAPPPHITTTTTNASSPSATCVRGDTDTDDFWCLFFDSTLQLARFDMQELKWHFAVPTLEDAGVLPQARIRAAIWYHADSFRVYFGFGRGPANGPFLNDLWVFNIASNSLQLLSDPKRDVENSPGKYTSTRVFSPDVYPSARSGAVFASHGDILYVGFGTGVSTHSQVGSLQDLWAYDTTLKQYAWLSGSLEANSVGSPLPFQGSFMVIDSQGTAYLVGGEYHVVSDGAFHWEEDYWSGIWAQNITAISTHVDTAGSVCYGVGRLLPFLDQCGGMCALKGNQVSCPTHTFLLDSSEEQQVIQESPLVTCDPYKCQSFDAARCFREELQCQGEVVKAELLPDHTRCQSDPGGYYLSTYPDIDSQFHKKPLMHWKKFGRFEGKRSCWAGGSWTHLLQINGTNSLSSCTVNQFPVSVPCKSMCSKPNHRNYCSCPISRLDHYCSTVRPYECRMTIKSPLAECAPAPRNVDPVCYSVSLKDDPTLFEIELECFYVNRAGLTNYTVANDDFSYSLRVGETQWAFAEGEILPKTELRLKPFNFYRLSDESGVSVVNVTTRNIAGLDTVSVALDFGTLPKSHFAGNRVYLELMLTQARRHQTGPLSVLGFHVDFEELPRISPQRRLSKHTTTRRLVHSVGGAEVSTNNSVHPAVLAIIGTMAAFNFGVIVYVCFCYHNPKKED